MRRKNWVPGGMMLNVSGLFRTASILIYLKSGGLRRWLPIHPCFKDNQELEEKIEAVAGVLDNLQDVIQHEIQVAFEPDLYVEPPTAFETFQQEVRECAEWKKDNPELWQTVLNKEIDVETYAFCLLSPDLRNRLLN